MILGRQSGLGRGLGAMIPPKSSIQQQTAGSRQHEEEVSTREHANPHIIVQQFTPPHRSKSASTAGTFDHTALEDLVASIIEHGVLSPLS